MIPGATISSREEEYNEIVSVVIPTYNRRDLLVQCILSVMAQDYPNIEIIVVDDNGTDDTASYLFERFPAVRLIHNESNLGPSFSKNKGILQSRGRYILFLDSDSEMLEKTVISKMCATLQQDKTIGEVGGSAVIREGRLDEVHGCTIRLDGSSGDVFISVKDPCREVMKEVDFIPTCNCMVEKCKLMEIGGTAFSGIQLQAFARSDPNWRILWVAGTAQL